MGLGLKAHCDCGYTADLIEGCGRSGPEPYYQLARCDRCREIVSIRTPCARRRCPTCRRAVSAITLERLRAFAPEAASDFENVQCPRCGKGTAVLTLVVLWD